MRGRKPTPVEVKQREGNPGHRPLPDTITVAGRPLPAELAEPPDTLGADGKQWWVETIPAAAASGLLDRIDRTQLMMMATCWDDWCKARRVVAVDGHFTHGSVGQLREHPALKIAREAVTQYDRLAEHFGFNPMSRTRLGLGQLQAAAKQAELERTLSGGTDDNGEPGYIDGTVASDDVGLPGA